MTTIDPNADLVGTRIVTGSNTLVVTGSSVMPQYVDCDVLNADGAKVGATCRPTALVRQAAREGRADG